MHPRKLPVLSFIFLAGALLLLLPAAAQDTGDPAEITDAQKRGWKSDIEKKLAGLQQQWKGRNETDLAIEFNSDTFRIEAFLERCTDQDYSTAGMRTALYEAAHGYDSLLNKYYKRLVAVLKAEDRKKAVAVQKAWMAYRDSEMTLVETISGEEYSGGGTLQQLTEASYYLDLVRSRTAAIYEHLRRATMEY